MLNTMNGHAQHSEWACLTQCYAQYNGTEMMSLCGDEFVVFVQHHALNIVNIHNVSDVVCLLEDGSRKMLTYFVEYLIRRYALGFEKLVSSSVTPSLKN